MISVLKSRDIEEQIKSLMAQALEDREGSQTPTPPGAGTGELRAYVEGRRERKVLDPVNIRELIVPGIGNRRIFRILLTNACKYSCDYCPMRAQRDLPRHALEPERLARIFMIAFRRGWCDGLFVTTGIPRGPVQATEKLLELVEILRLKLGFRGYVHVKALAGAEPGQVERLVRLVDRVSYNLEAACERTLMEHAPEKSVAGGVKLLEEAQRVTRTAEGRPGAPKAGGTPVGGMRAGATTQFVVGLGPESDRDLLSFAEGLERRRLIHHAQFAAFRPIRGTPLEGREETHPLRERRLYQAEHLIREYGFASAELVYDSEGKLPLDLDPKLRWALENPARFPVELAKATREELRRVPGVGPRTVERILRARATGAFRDGSDLKRVGAIPERALGFVAWKGRSLGKIQVQPSLFEGGNGPRGKAYEASPGTFR